MSSVQTARAFWVLGLAAAGLPLTPASAQEMPPAAPPSAVADAGATRSFVACPIYRDTDMGRKSGCWLADDGTSGQRYDVTWAPIKPQVDRAILVEGVVTSDADTCGGIVLNPVRVSVMEGLCPGWVLPAEQYPGRPSPPPVEALAPLSVPRELPPPPYEPRTFTIYFELGRDFLIYQHAEVVLEKIALYVTASKPKKIEIHGYAATDPVRFPRRTLVQERLEIAEARARMVREAMLRLGVAPELLTLAWSGSPAPTDLEGGRLPESSKRRVTVQVIP
jgi:outer membrane protein OmpA-like peptidoglycan-associated protein